MNPIVAPRDPIHDRPAQHTVDELLHELQTIHGQIRHDQHTAEASTCTGDTHYRDRMNGQAAACRRDADRIAALLWGLS